MTTQTQTNETFSGLHTIGYEAWKDLTESYLRNLEKVQAELMSLQSKELEQATCAIQDGAELIKRSLELTSDAYAGWRKQGLETSRAFVEAFKN